MNLENVCFNNPLFYLVKKELKLLYKTPVIYASAFVFVLGAGISFIGSDYWFNAGLSDLRAFFLTMPLLFCLNVPMLTMNLWADEKKQCTDKLLFLLPVSVRTIVVGKQISVMCVWFCILTVSMVIPVSVFALGYFTAWAFFLSYFAMLFFGIGVISISCALSAVSKYSAVNFLLSFLLILFFTFVYILTQKTGLPHYIKLILQYFSFTYHFESAARGIFDMRDFVFYFLLTALGMELNVYILYAQRNAL